MYLEQTEEVQDRPKLKDMACITKVNRSSKMFQTQKGKQQGKVNE
jgi:hypothetical protein